MKRLLLCAAVMMAFATFAKADTRGVPQGSGNPLATADYGGVEITTISFSSANYLLFGQAGGVFHGFHVSSRSISTDYLIVRATHTVTATPDAGAGADYLTTQEVFRVYMSTMVISNDGDFAVGNATISISPETVQGFTFWLKKPIRLKNGATVKFNNTRINLATIFYTKFD